MRLKMFQNDTLQDGTVYAKTQFETDFADGVEKVDK